MQLLLLRSVYLLPLLFLILIKNDCVFAQRQFNNECCEEYCYERDSEKLQTTQFGTKTAYELVKGAEYGRQYVVPNCKPTKIWMLSRHGTRLPNENEIHKLHDLEILRDEIIKNYEVRKSRPDYGGLCNEDKMLLKNWRIDRNITVDRNQYLTAQGWNDLKFLAKNYQRIFPDILEYQYSPNKFLFRHTDSQRTEASFKAFVEGLFGENTSNLIHLDPIPANDTFLKPYDSCSLWQENNENNNGPDSEVSKFRESTLYQTTVKDISTRLGFKYSLDSEQIEEIWAICRYELAWFLDRSSPWCTAFTKSQVDVLEYAEDLQYYYKSGYGNDVNSRVTCAAVQDMLKHLDRNDGPKVVTYFTHSATVQLFLTALGVAKDALPLTADNFYSNSRRKWKTSLIGPFAANLAAVKYDCSDDPVNKDKVIFFLNQNQVRLDWCNIGLCNWQTVKEKYDLFYNGDCADIFCNANSGNILKGSIALLLRIFIYVLF